MSAKVLTCQSSISARVSAPARKTPLALSNRHNLKACERWQAVKLKVGGYSQCRPAARDLTCAERAEAVRAFREHVVFC